MSFLPKTYEEGISDAVEMIDVILTNPDVDNVPSSIVLKLVRYGLLNPEEDDD